MKTSNGGNNEEENSNAKLLEISSKGNNFGLSKIEFHTLAEALKTGKEELFETIFLSHFEDCKTYIVKKYGISKERAYDITMDTLIEFRKLIIQDKITYGNLRFLFTKIASQKLMRSNKKKHRLDLKVYYDIEEHQDKEELFNVLTLAWKVLDEETQIILEAYFYNKTPLVQLAKTMGISDASIRKKKQRGLQKIRSIFLEKLRNKNNNYAE